MGVKVREKVEGSGEWWIFVNYKGRRTSKKVGTRQAAREAARKIEEEITLKRFKIERPEERKTLTFEEVARRWMGEHVELKMKPSSQFYYRGNLTRKWLPEFGSCDFAAITRRDIKAVVARWIEVGKDIRSIPNYLRTLLSTYPPGDICMGDRGRYCPRQSMPVPRQDLQG